jgi:hypothetical protein
MNKPAFIITIDTEGDNLWQNHRVIKTENARYLARFQTLCERFGFKPVWLTNYEMAIEPVFIEFARDVIARGQGRWECTFTHGIARRSTISRVMTGAGSLI